MVCAVVSITEKRADEKKGRESRVDEVEYNIRSNSGWWWYS